MKLEIRSTDSFKLSDAESFHLLYKNYYKALVCYAMKFIDNTAACEDIVQSHIVGMWGRSLSFSSTYALDMYLYNSVRNKCLDYLKHKGVERAYMQKVILENRPVELNEKEDMFDERVYKLLFDTIDLLPKRSREVFLRHLDGLSNQEIADALGMSVETVKTHKKRSMAFLRKRLGGSSLKLLIFILSIMPFSQKQDVLVV